jgi:hypothetical protein
VRPSGDDRAAEPPPAACSTRSSWRGTAAFQAARALEYAIPFLEKAAKVTLLVVGSKPDDVGASYLARNLAATTSTPTIDAIDPGAVSGRARGPRAARLHPRQECRLLVMGPMAAARC